MTYRTAKAFLQRNFVDGMYAGDNPYLSNVSIKSILDRWKHTDQLTDRDYLRLHYEFCVYPKENTNSFV